MSLFPTARAIPKTFQAGDGKYSESDAIHLITVPNGKLWQIIQCALNTIDSGTRVIKLVAENGDETGTIVYGSAGTGLICGPNSPTDKAYLAGPIMVTEKEQIKFQNGASQTTGGDYIFLRVLEFDLKEIMER